MFCCCLFIIANGDDLQVMEFEQDKMRQHLAKCFRESKLTPFPHIIRQHAYGNQYFPWREIDIYCDCELPEVYDNMIQCDDCDEWYHLRCFGLKSYNLRDKWYCHHCGVGVH